MRHRGRVGANVTGRSRSSRPSLTVEWIEDLSHRGITAGCGTAPPHYCPGASISRGQCAVFQSRTFGLALYGP